VTRLSGMAGPRALPGIGHNDGPPLDKGRSWRAYAWRRARAETLPKAPLEVVRRRVARAAALGLTYAQYASIHLGTGRDVAALLFTAGALGWHRRREPVPEAVVAKLGRIEGCERLLIARIPGHVPGTPFAAQGLAFEAAGPRPPQCAREAEIRAAIQAITLARGLPGDTVVLIGAREDTERAWIDAARLAKYLPAEAYFAP